MNSCRRYAAVLCCAFAAAAPAAAQNLVMEPHTIRDPMAVHRDAMTFLKPKGWTVEGGVKWYHNLTHLACLEIKVANPKTLEQIETFPWAYQTWLTKPIFPLQTGTNYMGSIVNRPLEDPRDVVEQMTLPLLRAQYKPRIVSSQDMPELAKVLSKQVGGAKVRSAKVRVEYALDGTDVEEDIYLSIFVNSMDIGGGNICYIWGPAWAPFSLRAAKGQLDEKTPLMLAAVNSARISPQWFGEYMYVSKLFQERQATSQRDIAKLSETIRRNSEEISKMYSDAYWNRQATQSRLSQNYSDYIRGVQRYDTPHERYPVQLPSGYRHAWTSPQGDYILSNDSGYNPNVGGVQNWQELKPAR